MVDVEKHSGFDEAQPAKSEAARVASPVEAPVGEELPNATPESKDDQSDGGVDGWITVLGAWFVQFTAVGVVSAFGVYESFYALHYLTSTSPSTISWIGSIQLFLELVLGPVGGILLDKGYMMTVLIVGSLLFLFSFFMLSLAHHNVFYQVLLSQGLGMGAAGGILYLPVTSIVSAHFKQRRALAMGISATGGSLGGAIFAILLNQLLNSNAGFAWGTRIAAFLCLFCLAVSMLLVRRPPSHRKVGAHHASTPVSPSDRGTFLYLLEDPAYVLALISGFTICLGLWTPPFLIQLYAQLHGVPDGLAFYSIAILNFSSCFGRVLPNMIADHIGVVPVLVGVVAINGAMCFGLLACGTAAGLVLVSIFYGFFSGATISLFFPLISSLATTPGDIGRRIGVSGFPLGIGMLVGPPISTALLGQERRWISCATFAGVVQIVGAVMVINVAVLVRYNKRRWSRIFGSRSNVSDVT